MAACQVVNTTEGANGLPRFTWKMAIKMVCVRVHVRENFISDI